MRPTVFTTRKVWSHNVNTYTVQKLSRSILILKDVVSNAVLDFDSERYRLHVITLSADLVPLYTLLAWQDSADCTPLDRRNRY